MQCTVLSNLCIFLLFIYCIIYFCSANSKTIADSIIVKLLASRFDSIAKSNSPRRFTPPARPPVFTIPLCNSCISCVLFTGSGSLQYSPLYLRFGSAVENYCPLENCSTSHPLRTAAVTRSRSSSSRSPEVFAIVWGQQKSREHECGALAVCYLMLCNHTSVTSALVRTYLRELNAELNI